MKVRKKDFGIGWEVKYGESSESWIMDAYPDVDVDMDMGIVIHAIERRC